MTTTSSERRLHPLTVLFETARWLPRMLLPLVLLLFTARGGALLFVLLPAAGITGALLVGSIVRYVRYRYHYDERDLVIRSGLFTRNERRIPYVRIQNLDAAQNPLHRILGVVEVFVQTGGGAEPEAVLRVLPVSALEEMRSRVQRAGGRTGAPSTPEVSGDPHPLPHPSTHPLPLPQPQQQQQQPPRRTLLTLTPRDLIVAGFIENRGMVLIVGALALLEQSGVTSRFIEQLFETERFVFAQAATRWFGGNEVPMLSGALLVIGALLTVLLFIRLLSTVWAVVRLYDFRLERVGDDLVTQYGLFTRVSATIPLRRVQTIIVSDRVLHRVLGRHTVTVETAGGMAVEGGPQREPIAPIMHAADLPALLAELHPGLSIDGIDWQPVHPRAFGRMLRSMLGWPILLAIGTYFVVQTWAVAILVMLLPYAFFHARLRVRYLAWSLTGDAVVVRDGALTRSTRIARFSRVQVPALRRNPFDMRTGMASIHADTAGARQAVAVPYLPERTATDLHREIVARTEATEFTW
jgi:putative membrane protein